MSMYWCEYHQTYEDADYAGYNSVNAGRHEYCDEAWAELYPDPWTVHGITHPGSMDYFASARQKRIK